MNTSGNEAQPTIKDVAAHAGVSRATASRALSDYGIVNAETRERVQRAAADLGYMPNVLARSMRAGTTQTIGLIITEIGLSVFDLAVRVVIDDVHAHGYQVLVATTNENLSSEVDALRVMLEKQVDGVILVPSAVNDLSFLSERALASKPVVLLDRELPNSGLLSAIADNRQGARDAVAHLVEHGHRRIGLLVSTANIHSVTSVRPSGLVSSLNDRVEGYWEALDTAGVARDPELVRFSGGSGEPALLAARELLAAPHPPTALIASNANVSLAILQAAQEIGLRVGEELSLIGFDDAPWAPIVTPALTVIDLPIEQMAKAAVDELIAQIQARRPTTHRPHIAPFPMTLISRASVARISDVAAPSRETR